MTSAVSLEGQVAIVTGAGRHRGLGESIARAFASSGANVVIADLGHTQGTQFPEHGVASQSEMDEVSEQLSALGGGQVRSHVCDVRHEAQIAALVEYAVRQFGSLDIVVNNAGIGYLMAPVHEISTEDWDAVHAPGGFSARLGSVIPVNVKPGIRRWARTRQPSVDLRLCSRASVRTFTPALLTL